MVSGTRSTYAARSVLLPPAIRAWLTAYVERNWPEPPALPDDLPVGVVQKLAGRGPFGLMLEARLDVVDGRVALEALENSRMSGESYFRVWEDGTVEPLEPAPRLNHFVGEEDEYFAHNRTAYNHLRERGFFA
jgi:hypothetical protein